MKLGELLKELGRIEAHAAVYEELVNHLDNILDSEDEEILMESGDGVVADEYVREVCAQLREKVEQLEDQLADA